jgi:uncharacterized membrane protein HdeD (DUF308 family)
MDSLLSQRWWTFAVRALVAALFGSAILTRQSVSLHEFSRWFGIAALLIGPLALYAAVRRADAGNPWGDPGWDGTSTYWLDPAWRAVAAEGVASGVAGFIVLVAPIADEQVLFGIIAGAAFAVAVAQGLAAAEFSSLAAGGWAMSLSAAVSVATGLVLVGMHGSAAIDRMRVVGAAALIEAVLLAAIAVPLQRRWSIASAPRLVPVRAVALVPERTVRS